MDIEQTILKYADNRMNHERARAFGAPVLRSLSPDAILMGYSVTAEREVDRIVEANHVLRSSLSTGVPMGFTTRTFKPAHNVSLEHAFHALDYLLNYDPKWREEGLSQSERDELLARVQGLPIAEVRVRIDGWDFPAMGSTFEGATFAFLTDEGSGALISIAAPTPIFAEEFTTRVDQG